MDEDYEEIGEKQGQYDAISRTELATREGGVNGSR
jgi:hypothetical protein